MLLKSYFYSVNEFYHYLFVICVLRCFIIGYIFIILPFYSFIQGLNQNFIIIIIILNPLQKGLRLRGKVRECGRTQQNTKD